jgi:hypothetical protein
MRSRCACTIGLTAEVVQRGEIGEEYDGLQVTLDKVACHVSRVKWHMSSVTCHVWFVTCKALRRSVLPEYLFARLVPATISKKSTPSRRFTHDSIATARSGGKVNNVSGTCFANPPAI